MFTMSSDALKRLVLAELVRQRLDADGEGVTAAQVMKVTGYQEREVVRYPGTSSTWTEYCVDIFWLDDAEDAQVYQWFGTIAELDEELVQLVARY